MERVRKGPFLLTLRDALTAHLVLQGFVAYLKYASSTFPANCARRGVSRCLTTPTSGFSDVVGRCERVDKPGSVVRTAIYLECASPRISSAQPERTEGQPYRVPICTCSRWGLPSYAVADALVRSYRTVSAFLLQGACKPPLCEGALALVSGWPASTLQGSFLFCGTFRRVAPPSC